MKLALAILAAISTVVFPPGNVVTTAGASRPPTLRIAITGDPQNCARQPRAEDFPPATQLTLDAWEASAESDCKAMVDDIIAYRPDFVVIAGDLANDNGGFDQNTTWGIADDPNTLLDYTNNQTINYRTRIYDRFLAAGIPVFHTVGNHDSCIDFGRAFPPSEWLAYSWGREVHSRAGLCGLEHIADTTHRVGLFQSPIGTICVIGLPTRLGDHDAPDNGWLETSVGCGSGRPTIIVVHTDGANSWLGAFEAKNKVIAVIEGHQVCGFGCAKSKQTDISSGAVHTISILVNTQDVDFGALWTPGAGTGGGWWSSWEVDPGANTAKLQAHNPTLGNTSISPSPSDYVMLNTTLSFATAFCTTFPGGPGC